MTKCENGHNCPQEQRFQKIEEQATTTRNDLMAILRDMKKDYRQIIYAMIGLIGAILGVKLVGSTSWEDIRAFTAAFAGVFLLSACIFEWRRLRLWMRLSTVLVAVFILVSTYSRIFIFRAGVEPSPSWYESVVDGFFVVISVAMVLAVWKRKP